MVGPDFDHGQFEALAREAAEFLARYYADLPDLPIMPQARASAVRERLAEDPPQQGCGVEEALAAVRDVVYPLSRHNGHPRFFGYVASPGTPVAAVGEMLAAGLNANVTSWRSAPAPTAMELLVVEWFKSMIGYAPEAAGLLVSGGSMANFAALAAARAAVDPDSARLGNARGAPALRVYVSEEGHFSIQKAARLLGIGSENVQAIATDAAFRIDSGELRRRIRADREAGMRPMCVVANAGSVNTGAFDPLAELADVAANEGMWLHVDGAYGGFSALAPSAGPLFAGIERADSVTLDPHKWLYSAMGCGCILYRDAQTAVRAFGQSAEYTRPVGWTGDESFAFWDLGPELSRPFRALPVWLQIKVHGVRAIAAAIERNLACARHLGNQVEAAADFELLAPVGLSICCFRFRPPSFAGDPDELNERVLIELQRRGSSYVSNARVRGKFALRACVLNYRTTEADMDRLLDDVREAAAAVMTR